MSVVKFFLMILVVLYHSMLCSAGWDWAPQDAYKTSVVLNYIAKYLNYVHIYAFTFVSGYVFSFLYFETNRYVDFKTVIHKKVRRLIIPYISTVALWVIPFYCVFWKPDIKQIVEKYVLGISPSQLWFLLMLFWQFVFFQYFASKIFSNTKTTGVGGVLFILCWYAGAFLEKMGVPNIYQLLTAMKYFLYFYLGMLFRKRDFLERIRANVVLGGAIVSISTFVLIQYLYAKGGNLKTIGTLLCPVVSVTGVYAIVIGLLLLDRKRPIEKLKIDPGMTIYLFHQQLIYVSICLFNKPWMPPIGLTMVNFGVGLLGSIGIHLILQKSKATRFLFGLE